MKQSEGAPAMLRIKSLTAPIAACALLSGGGGALAQPRDGNQLRQEYAPFSRTNVQLTRLVNQCVFGQRHVAHVTIALDPSEEAEFAQLKFDISQLNTVDADICNNRVYSAIPEDNRLNIEFAVQKAEVCESAYEQAIQSKHFAGARSAMITETQTLELIQSAFAKAELLGWGQAGENKASSTLGLLSILISPRKSSTEIGEMLASSNNSAQMMKALAIYKVNEKLKDIPTEEMYKEMSNAIVEKNLSNEDVGPPKVDPRICQ